jgi:hypothetical protein
LGTNADYRWIEMLEEVVAVVAERSCSVRALDKE